MALVKIESFDLQNETILPGSFDSFFNNDTDETTHTGYTISLPYGRDHSSGLRLYTGDYHYGGLARLYTFTNYLTSCVLGVAFMMEIAGDGSGIFRESYNRIPLPILTFYDGVAPQITIVIDGAMRVRVYRAGTQGTLLKTSTDALHNNVWHYLEIDLDIANIIGAITVRLDGKPIITEINIDTQDTVNQQITSVALGGAQDYLPFDYPATYVRFDDFYLFDKTGGSNNTMVGDVQIKGLSPVSDGPKKEWEPSTGTLHYDMLDDSVPPFMTNYVQSGTIGAIDVYRYGTISTPAGTIHAISLNPYASKSNTLITAIASMVSDGATYSASSNIYLTGEGQYWKSNFETNPIAGGRFTLAQIAAYYFGVKRIV